MMTNSRKPKKYMPKNKSKKTNYTYAVGRRKSASARVRIFRGKGQNTVNSKSVDNYFPGKINMDIWSKPFKVLDVVEKYYFSAKVKGGGIQAQLTAISHGIARALGKETPEFRKPLKAAGLLTRDSRTRERRKAGMGGKARRKKQSPKR